MVNLLDDMERLRLGQSYADVLAVEDLILEMPVRKPKPQAFVRVHPDLFPRHLVRRIIFRGRAVVHKRRV